jgi:nucleotide-binding universal stress UspA family protein
VNQDGPILLAYDGSPAARAAIALAGDHLQKDRKAMVLSVYQPLESVPFIGAPAIRIPAGVDEQIHAATEKLAEEGAELARNAGFEATGCVGHIKGTVSETIVSFAKDQDASLIILGTHGRSGVRGALLGSVATAVMHHADRPVTVVPESFVRARTD